MNKWLIGEEKEKCEEDYSKILFYHQVSKDFFFSSKMLAVML